MNRVEKMATGGVSVLLSLLLVLFGGTAAQAADGGSLAETGATGFAAAAGIVAVLLVLGAALLLIRSIRNRRANADDSDTSES